MRKLSLVVALLLGSAIVAGAADDLANAFKDGKFDGRIRLQYFNTDWDTNDWGSKADGDSRGAAIGGSLFYKTAPVHGLSAGVGFYTTHAIDSWTDDNNGVTPGHPKNTTALDLFARGPGATTNFGDGYSVLAQSYLQYDIAKSKVTGGRFLMNNPWITPNDTKMIPIVVQGAQVISNDIENTTIQVDYANKIKERGMTYFGSMADTGDTPVAIKNYYSTRYTDTTKTGYGVDEASGVAIAGVKNKSINSLELEAWGMHWQDIIEQVMLEANYGIKTGDIGIKFGARYMQQFDQGAGDIIMPKTGSIYDSAKVKYKGDSDNSVDTYMYALRTIISYGSSKVLLAYSHTSKDGDLIAPWRGFPTYDYTRSMTITDWNANTYAYKVQYDYDFNALVKGLSGFVSYSYYDRDPSKVGYQGATDRYYNNGDTHQWNIDSVYQVASVKGLEVKARYMIQYNQIVTNIAGNTGTKSEGYGNDTSNKELRLEANYRF